MGRMLTAPTGTSTIFRRNDAGQVVEVEAKREDWSPPRGRYRLRWNGTSPTFELPNQFKEGELQTKVSIEFLILKGNNLTGRTFTELMTWSIHPKSTLGKLVGALRGAPIKPGDEVDPDTYIGTEFIASVALDDKGKYANVVPESVEPDSIKLPLAARAAGSSTAADLADDLPPELAGVAAGGGADADPFEIEAL